MTHDEAEWQAIGARVRQYARPNETMLETFLRLLKEAGWTEIRQILSKTEHLTS